MLSIYYSHGLLANWLYYIHVHLVLTLSYMWLFIHARWFISRFTVVSREAKEEAASGAPTDSRLTLVSILQEQEL